MKFQYGDLVRFRNNYGMYASKGDEGTIQHIDKYDNIIVLVESGEFAGRFEEVREEDLELIDRLTDEELALLEEENKMLKFKEGQTYICTESHASQWTEGKEYKVYFNNNTHAFALSDNNLTLWYEDELNEGQHKFKLKEETETTDLIDNQPHYKNQGIEPIDLMRKNFSKEEFAGFLQGNVLKYMLRYKDKNGLEDLKKAKTYLTWLIEEELW